MLPFYINWISKLVSQYRISTVNLLTSKLQELVKFCNGFDWSYFVMQEKWNWIEIKTQVQNLPEEQLEEFRSRSQIIILKSYIPFIPGLSEQAKIFKTENKISCECNKF